MLMGERLAETEPELFTSAVEAKPAERADLTSPDRQLKWKRAKRARSAHGPRGRKPKRSNVKYARPFNDDLPW